MNRISVVLGAGFSYNAGLPMANDINQYFDRDNSRSLLNFSSGEWKWSDLASEIDKRNGLNFMSKPYGFILNELVNAFKMSIANYKNYEDFFQFVIDNINEDDFLREICDRSYKAFHMDLNICESDEYYDIYRHPFKSPSVNEILNMINHLISDLLYWKASIQEFEYKYDPFFSYLSRFEKKDVFTLNHDYLLETLLSRKSINYCDGFSDKESELQNEEKKRIYCFNGLFDSPFNLIKLHGSVDMYKYICVDQKGITLYPNGKSIYYKTQSFYDKQKPIRVDVETGNVVQNLHWNITPQFITGTRKNELIKNDLMYSKLYELLNEKLCQSYTLLIIGYSFGDVHVNSQIQKAINVGKLSKIVNVNPYNKIPLSLPNVEIIEVSSIEDLHSGM